MPRAYKHCMRMTQRAAVLRCRCSAPFHFLAYRMSACQRPRHDAHCQLASGFWFLACSYSGATHLPVVQVEAALGQQPPVDLAHVHVRRLLLRFQFGWELVGACRLLAHVCSSRS